MPRSTARRPHHDHHAGVKKTRRNEASFAGGPAVRSTRGVQPCKDVARAAKIQAALMQGLDALGLSPRDPHLFMYPH